MSGSLVVGRNIHRGSYDLATKSEATAEAEIPWPHSLPSVSGASAADAPAEAKKPLGLGGLLSSSRPLWHSNVYACLHLCQYIV